jgi:hypothetical protein
MVPKALLGFLLFGAVLAAVNFPSDTQCTDFCMGYMMNCSATYNIYQDQTACEMECSRWPITTTCATAGKGAGCDDASNENSYDCRLYHLSVASANPVNLVPHCPHATPLSCMAEDNNINGGQCLDLPQDAATDTPLAGTIEDLCNNLVKTCGTLFGTAALTMQYCYNAMYYIPQINDLSTYPMNGTGFPVAPQTGADSFLCRRYHVDVAGNGVAGNQMTHCPHAFTGNDQCGSDCDFYCDLVQNVCAPGSANEQYANNADCMAACADFDTVAFSSALPTTGNTLNCRIYHATVAAQSPDNAAVHCPHTGMMSSPDTCGSGAFTVSASLFLVAVLAFFSLN